MKKWNVICILSVLALQCAAVPVKLTGKVINETIEIAAKRSGRVLTPASKKATEKALVKAFSRYGDDVLKAMQKGGLETLKQGAKHGDDFWRICAKTTPQGARSLALHADILMPLVKRNGIQFMALESKVPGLGAKTVQTFGDDAVKTFAKAPASDITRMVGYAGKADNPKTVKLLHEAYAKSEGKILDHLNWKHIMAGGLSASAIVAAYKLTNSVETLAETNPELLAQVLNANLPWIALILAGILLFILVLLFPGRIRNAFVKLFSKNKSMKKENQV